MQLSTSSVRRRQVLRGMAGALGASAISFFPFLSSAQGRPDAAGMRVTQLLDMSPDQQQLSRDYSTGIRLAFAELKKAGQPVPQLSTVETDGSTTAVRNALQLIRDDTSQVALLGTAGEGVALASMSESSQLKLDIAHVAPWLADPQMDDNPRLFALFASREEQIRYVLKTLSVVGVHELGLVYPSQAHADTIQAGMAAIGGRLQLKTRSLVIPKDKDIAAYATQLPADAPFFLMFMGGAIELALFTQGLNKLGRQRYVLCLSDVDTNTFLQLNPGKTVPVIFTDVVPNPHTSKLPVVRNYRSLLQNLYDEAPTPVSLAGYLAGRYAATVLASVGAGATRARVLAEFQRRRPLELDGWHLAFNAQGRASSFVSQTMLNTRGNFVG
ncbi:ABC transporter substrate-binding protein [Variovorax sp. OV329]|uniref:ABC transporter substrate-binding protein n=1 Tax=Variovorax sp. OV329 TaxID=1882825 RepID=UPI0008DFEA8D|nr:ABC transporter substrate-binding protein [Variovorax sp. OV329]SFM56577.1 amino acid/amide ABC transporter substrate-binding protein, HAAT family [Variovorax sp. OV329]